MKKGDDFFRITFNRSSEEIQRFEKNLSEYTKHSNISRPAIIAAICNHFIENNMELSVMSGRYVVKLDNMTQSKEISHAKKEVPLTLPIVANTEVLAELEINATISASDSDEMLRAMGLL